MPDLTVPLPVPLEDLAAAFLANVSVSTRIAYRRDLERFVSWSGARSLADAARTLLQRGHGHANGVALAYRGHLVASELAPNTINRRLSALRALVRFARVLGLVAWELELVDVRVVKYRETRGPGIAGVRALLAVAAGQQPYKAARDVAILRLFYDLGLRLHEVTSLDRAHIDLGQGLVQVMGKGSRERVPLTLPPPTSAAVQAWLELRGEDPGPLFFDCGRGRAQHGRLSDRSVERMVAWLGNRAGLRAWPHGLRHTAVTQALELTNGDFRKVARFSRHADIRTIQHYDDNREDLGGQVAQLVALAL